MQRLFIGVKIPDGIKQTVREFQENLTRQKNKLRWTASENIHITLKFLGDTHDDVYNKMIEYFDGKALAHPDFTISLKGIGVFPNAKAPRIFWIGLNKGQKELTNLAKIIDNDFQEFGFAKEKRIFNPHVTIGRRKSFDPALKVDYTFLREHPFPELEFAAGKIHIIKSTLDPKGAIYESLHSKTFG